MVKYLADYGTPLGKLLYFVKSFKIKPIVLNIYVVIMPIKIINVDDISLPLYYVCTSSYTNRRRKSLSTCTVTPQANHQTLNKEI